MENSALLMVISILYNSLITLCTFTRIAALKFTTLSKPFMRPLVSKWHPKTNHNLHGFIATNKWSITSYKNMYLQFHVYMEYYIIQYSSKALNLRRIIYVQQAWWIFISCTVKSLQHQFQQNANELTNSIQINKLLMPKGHISSINSSPKRKINCLNTYIIFFPSCNLLFVYKSFVK